MTQTLKKDAPETDPVIVYINLFDLRHPEDGGRRLLFPRTHRMISFMGFTEDSESMLVLCDRKVVYCFQVETGKLLYQKTFALCKHSELYAENGTAPIYAFTAEYHTRDTAADCCFPWESGELDEDSSMFPTPCALCRLAPSSGKL